MGDGRCAMGDRRWAVWYTRLQHLISVQEFEHRHTATTWYTRCCGACLLNLVYQMHPPHHTELRQRHVLQHVKPASTAWYTRCTPRS